MKAHHHLLSDILEMLASRLEFRPFIAGTEAERSSRIIVGNTTIDLLHRDLDTDTLQITVHEGFRLYVQGSLNHCADGEIVVDFVLGVLAMLDARAEA